MKPLAWMKNLFVPTEREAVRLDKEAALSAKIRSELQLKHADDQLRLVKEASRGVDAVNVRNHFSEVINGLIAGNPRDIR